MLIGLTGGIACGKSTVSAYLLGKGCAIIDADKIARQVLEPGQSGYKAVLRAFGSDHDILMNQSSTIAHDKCLQPEIDRKKLGAVVFGDVEKRRLLNRCTHPYILREIFRQIMVLSLFSRHRLIFIDAPLLIEGGLWKWSIVNVLVDVGSVDNQLDRLLKRNPELTVDEAIKRIRSQMTVEQKKKIVSGDSPLLILDNSTGGDLNRLYTQVDQLISDLNQLWFWNFVMWLTGICLIAVASFMFS